MHWKEKVGIGDLAKIDAEISTYIASSIRGLKEGLDKIEGCRKKDGLVG